MQKSNVDDLAVTAEIVEILESLGDDRTIARVLNFLGDRYSQKAQEKQRADAIQREKMQLLAKQLPKAEPVGGQAVPAKVEEVGK